MAETGTAKKMARKSPQQQRGAGLAGGITDFLRTLKDMEQKGETTRTKAGKTAGSWATARYKYRVRIGIAPGRIKIK